MAKARPQLIALGASNLTRGLSVVLSWLSANSFAPFDLYTALGYGRSYGIRSKVLFRELPGIQESAIWQALAARGPAELAADHFAILTDIGNDLFYQVPVDQIVAWLSDALRRLKAMNAKIILVQIPLGNIEKVGPVRFFILRNILFPGRDLQRDVIRAQAYRLGEDIARLAKDFGAVLMTQDASWYGFDPIHYKTRLLRHAWSCVLRSWIAADQVELAPKRLGLRFWAYVRSRAPHERGIFGKIARKEQPAGRLAGGSKIWLY